MDFCEGNLSLGMIIRFTEGEISTKEREIGLKVLRRNSEYYVNLLDFRWHADQDDSKFEELL